MQSESLVRDPSLAPDGHRKIDWAAEHSPVLNRVRDEYLKDGTFEGLGVGVSLPIEAKTAYLTVVLAEAGAEVSVASPGPVLCPGRRGRRPRRARRDGLRLIGGRPRRGRPALERVLDRVADGRDAVLIDDRAGLTRLAHTTRRELLPRIRGASEETTSGVAKFKAMEREGILEFPTVAANDARCKYLFDNRYGTGQSAITAIMQNTNLMMGGKRLVVLGYGWCGKGIARYAAGLGARVSVCEVDPVRGLEPTPTASTSCRRSGRARRGRSL
jgi:adenosylhomocysteinase